jgi:hypothetical protein
MSLANSFVPPYKERIGEALPYGINLLLNLDSPPSDDTIPMVELRHDENAPLMGIRELLHQFPVIPIEQLLAHILQYPDAVDIWADLSFMTSLFTELLSALEENNMLGAIHLTAVLGHIVRVSSSVRSIAAQLSEYLMDMLRNFFHVEEFRQGILDVIGVLLTYDPFLALTHFHGLMQIQLDNLRSKPSFIDHIRIVTSMWNLCRFLDRESLRQLFPRDMVSAWLTALVELGAGESLEQVMLFACLLLM